MSPEEIVPADAATPEKPKVVRRKRTTKTAEEAQPSAAGDVAVAEAPAKPKRAPRRTAAQKAADEAAAKLGEGAPTPRETASAAPEAAVSAPVAAAPQETPRRKASSRQSSAPQEAPAPQAPNQAETPTPAPVSVAPVQSENSSATPSASVATPPTDGTSGSGSGDNGVKAFTPRVENNRENGMRYENRGERFGNRDRDNVPRDNTPRESSPRDNGPRDIVPRDGMPRDNAPRDVAPRDGAPRDNAPQGDAGNFNSENRGPASEGQGDNFGGDRGFDNDRGFEGRLRFRGNRNQLRRERGNNRNGRFGGPVNGENNFNSQPQQRRRDYEILALQGMEMEELGGVAGEFNIETLPEEKDALIYAILEAQAYSQNALLKRGTLEILSDGKGFLRCDGYLPNDGDVYVSQSQIKRFNLKTGDLVLGTVRTPKEMERFHGLLRVEAINGLSPEVMKQRKEFEKLTPIFPTEKFVLETEPTNITARIIDLVSPIGKGSRGLIVAPPKAGKTTLIKNIANSIAQNHPEVVLIVLLIDERPEEVTDISRSIRGEVVASTFDELPENHMRVADIVMEKAKRLVEMKQDVVILLDSITRLSRASNLVVTPSGRTLSGGLDPAAMYRPKRMFGAARNIEEGGSLTILATALVDTGSRMDEMIFEEFKGTGNLDLVLDRNLFDQRIFPAIDINRSGTRRDDLLLGKEDLATVFHLRRTLAQLDNDKAVTLLIDRLKNTKSNLDFMNVVAKSARNVGNGA
jgi:transcription termination factor Rho